MSQPTDQPKTAAEVARDELTMLREKSARDDAKIAKLMAFVEAYDQWNQNEGHYDPDEIVNLEKTRADLSSEEAMAD